MDSRSIRLHFVGFARWLILTVGLFSIASGAYAQSPFPKCLSQAEQRSIEKEHGEKDRLEVLLKVSSSRLTSARSCMSGEHYEEAQDEIKNYAELISYTSSFLQGLQKKENDKRKYYKLMEQSLRRDLNALESMRYDMPQKYADEANEIYQQVR